MDKLWALLDAQAAQKELEAKRKQAKLREKFDKGNTPDDSEDESPADWSWEVQKEVDDDRESNEAHSQQSANEPSKSTSQRRPPGCLQVQATQGGETEGRLWEAFGNNSGWERSEFSNFVSNASAADLEEVGNAVKLRAQAKKGTPHTPTPKLSKSARKLEKSLSKSGSAWKKKSVERNKPAERKPVERTPVERKPVGRTPVERTPAELKSVRSDDKTMPPQLHESLQRGRVRCFARQHPYVTTKPDPNDARTAEQYVNDVYNYARKQCGLREQLALELAKDAKTNLGASDGQAPDVKVTKRSKRKREDKTGDTGVVNCDNHGCATENGALQPDVDGAPKAKKRKLANKQNNKSAHVEANGPTETLDNKSSHTDTDVAPKSNIPKHVKKQDAQVQADGQARVPTDNGAIPPDTDTASNPKKRKHPKQQDSESDRAQADGFMGFTKGKPLQADVEVAPQLKKRKLEDSKATQAEFEADEPTEVPNNKPFHISALRAERAVQTDVSTEFFINKPSYTTTPTPSMQQTHAHTESTASNKTKSKMHKERRQKLHQRIAQITADTTNPSSIPNLAMELSPTVHPTKKPTPVDERPSNVSDMEPSTPPPRETAFISVISPELGVIARQENNTTKFTANNTATDNEEQDDWTEHGSKIKPFIIPETPPLETQQLERRITQQIPTELQDSDSGFSGYSRESSPPTIFKLPPRYSPEAITELKRQGALASEMGGEEEGFRCPMSWRL